MLCACCNNRFHIVSHVSFCGYFENSDVAGSIVRFNTAEKLDLLSPENFSLF